LRVILEQHGERAGRIETMGPLIGGLILFLVVAIFLLGLERINNTLKKILEVLEEGRVAQDRGNDQRQLGLTYLYSMAKRQAGSVPTSSPAPDPPSPTQS
jgi:hypothetical protein